MVFKNTKSVFILILVALALMLGVVFSFNNATGQEGGRKIVVFDGTLNEPARERLIANHGGVKVKDLFLINASVVLLPSKASEKALEQRPGVLRVDDDVFVSIPNPVIASAKPEGKGKPAPAPQLSQVLPWGIDRVDADLVWLIGNTADPVKVAVVDTGISKDHPDLSDNLKGGVNFVFQKGAVDPNGWNDDNGHGSHVAGIVGAANNTIGVVGAAPMVDLYAVKVLDRRGSGYLSDVISGIEWAKNNGMQVINMSLGTASDIQSFHDAVAAAYNAGLVVVAAAGNSGAAVSYPAAYPEVIAVSATDSNNNLASFSSRGPEVDLAAPGVSVYSTYKGTGYATLSGTSMASPHVAGSAALVLNTPVGTYDANANGKWDPSEVQQKLQDRATDLGVGGYDTLYGWGLVNAYNAVLP